MSWTLPFLVVLVGGGLWFLARTLDTEERRLQARYDWLAGNSAPECCPMEIAEGSAFLLSNGGSLYIPPATIRPGWGDSSSVHVVGEKLKALPNRLMITFYSYPEDKLYHGLFDLPAQRIADMFADGFVDYRNGGKRRTYDTITAGVAPGGAVSVWLVGIGNTTQVFFDHAKELDRDFHQTLQISTRVDRTVRRERELASAAQAMKSNGVSLGRDTTSAIWDGYQRRYLWRLNFDEMETPSTIYHVHYYNGDHLSWPWPVPEQTWSEARPIPSSLGFRVKVANEELGRSYGVEFNERELFDAFNRLSRSNGLIEFVFRRSPKLGVYLRSQGEEIVLDQAERFYQETKKR